MICYVYVDDSISICVKFFLEGVICLQEDKESIKRSVVCACRFLLGMLIDVY